MGNSPRIVLIHILDDNPLLHIFYLYRPFLLCEDEDDNTRLWGGSGRWVRGRWWYRLAHICQRWRNVILGLASYLGVSLVCTFGTPAADMLAHSPRLPLDIDFFERDRNVTAEDENGAILALRHRDRVRRVRLNIPVTNMQRLIVAMDGVYPILEYLVIAYPVKDESAILTLPETLQAPHLRLLRLRGFALPIGSQLLTTAVGLVTLSLIMAHPSTYFHPNTLLRWISLMPQLKTLEIHVVDVGGQHTHTPTIAPITLPNLDNYLEALVHRITAPRLEKLHITLLNQLTYFVPRLLQFLNTTENLRCDSAQFGFLTGRVYVMVYPHEETDSDVYALGIEVLCWHLDWQISSMAQICHSLSQILSGVEHLNFVHGEHSQSSEEHNEVDRTEWRKLLRPFSNVNSLYIDTGLVKDLSRCLKLEGGEPPLEVLSELQELRYSGSSDAGDAFTSFIDARRNAGRPVTLVRS